ncbi:methyltransferase domain-containing protein [Paraburkholderia sediminicola]|uniref:Methyltransferase domain-containing protein n=1 Tax=Paraburkholderia rhynchosiae TaxID=487049 RepID=A0ACC7N4M4_9BURK
MNCMICGSQNRYYFSKTYTESPFDELMCDIGPVDYARCTHCGFVSSITHGTLDAEVWGTLNARFHHFLENPASEKTCNQPPYAEQAMMLALLGTNGIVSTDSMVDYAAGYGTLSSILHKYHDIDLPVFDPFVKNEGAHHYIDIENLGKYRTVINSAMFEHVRSREDLDAVNRLVDKDGCLIIHTVICENVPNDPNWFYLVPPVHTAFHTNASMRILMREWGYASSLYCPPAKCWVLFKRDQPGLSDAIESINQELQSIWFVFKNGFVDYWKGF